MCSFFYINYASIKLLKIALTISLLSGTKRFLRLIYIFPSQSWNAPFLWETMVPFSRKWNLETRILVPSLFIAVEVLLLPEPLSRQGYGIYVLICVCACLCVYVCVCPHLLHLLFICLVVRNLALCPQLNDIFDQSPYTNQSPIAISYIKYIILSNSFI